MTERPFDQDRGEAGDRRPGDLRPGGLAPAPEEDAPEEDAPEDDAPEENTAAGEAGESESKGRDDGPRTWERPSGGLATPRPGGWRPSRPDDDARRVPVPPGWRERLDRPRPSLPGDPLGPARPTSSPAAAADRAAMTRPLPPIPAPPRPASPDEATRPFRHPGAAFVQPASAPAPVRPAPAAEPSVTAAAPRVAPPAEPLVRPTPPVRREGPIEPRPEPKPALVEPRPVEKPGLPAGPSTRRVVKISPRSVFRVALAVYLGILATVVAATTGLWLMLEGTGTIENIESFMGELLGYEDFQFLFGRIFLVLTLLGLVWVVISATVTSLLAALYNRVARLTGGIRVTVDDDA